MVSFLPFSFPHIPAGHKVGPIDFAVRWLLGTTLLCAVLAAGMELTAIWQILCIGNVSGNVCQTVSGTVQKRYCTKQAPCVPMHRMLEHLIHAAILYNGSGVHDGNLLAEL